MNGDHFELVRAATSWAQKWSPDQPIPLAAGMNEVVGGVGKRTFHMRSGNTAVALQFRRNRNYYEPVVEAVPDWLASGCLVPALRAWGEVPNYKFFIYDWIDGHRADLLLPSLASQAATKLLVEIGRAFSSLCSVETSGFGYFRHGLSANAQTWEEFVVDRICGSAKRTLASGALSAPLARDINKALPRLKTTIRPLRMAHLVYVDTNLANVIIRRADRLPVMIDHDYLVSGDPRWALARMEVLYSDCAALAPLVEGFCWQMGLCAREELITYRISHALELMLLDRGVGEQSAARLSRLEALIASDLRWSA